MKVIFLQNVKNVARIGDIKDVAGGYARNFLFPRNIASLATLVSAKQSELLKQKYAQTQELDRQSALEMSDKLKDMVVEFTVDANEEGNLYGSITEKDIVAKLAEQHVTIERDAVTMAEHIKTVGEHEVTLELDPEVKVQLKVNVIKK